MHKKSIINKILLLIFVSISLEASILLEEYRQNGINEIQKRMDLQLTTKEYWAQYIKDKDTKFGYIESYSSILTCNKEKSILNLYSKDENQTYSFKQNYDAFTGEVPGDKVKEGDLKTPIGIYELTKRIDKLDSFYGPLALVTSYPNTYDTYRGKNGSGIWIHGLPINQKRDDFTRGCIAINNENIECLDKIINIKKTILIINETETSKSVSKDLLSSILSQLYTWRYHWIYNDTEKYLEFYANDFVRKDKMALEEFKNYKIRIFNKKEKKEILFNDINIIPYPNTQDVYQITFKEFYKSNSFSFIGDKTLIVRADNNNTIKIFTEE